MLQATPAIRAMPTQSGRFLLSAKDQPLTAEEKQQMTAVIKENPEAQAKLAELADAAQMGLQLKYSKSPAFIGLAVIDVHSAELEGYKAPQIQIVCEDDKVRPAHRLHLPCCAARRARIMPAPIDVTQGDATWGPR